MRAISRSNVMGVVMMSWPQAVRPPQSMRSPHRADSAPRTSRSWPRPGRGHFIATALRCAGESLRRTYFIAAARSITLWGKILSRRCTPINVDLKITSLIGVDLRLTSGHTVHGTDRQIFEAKVRPRRTAPLPQMLAPKLPFIKADVTPVGRSGGEQEPDPAGIASRDLSIQIGNHRACGGAPRPAVLASGATGPSGIAVK